MFEQRELSPVCTSWVPRGEPSEPCQDREGAALRGKVRVLWVPQFVQSEDNSRLIQDIP